MRRPDTKHWREHVEGWLGDMADENLGDSADMYEVLRGFEETLDYVAVLEKAGPTLAQKEALDKGVLLNGQVLTLTEIRTIAKALKLMRPDNSVTARAQTILFDMFNQLLVDM